MSLTKEIEKLQKSSISTVIKNKLKEFESFQEKGNQEWFSELCFCILTANSKAHTALNIEKELGMHGFHNADLASIRECIKRNKHRFHNKKAEYILQARKHKDIKTKLSSLSEEEAREWLIRNIRGLGYKESSHFLRNVGCKNLAILDRHIINILHQFGYLKKPERPKSRKEYLKIEKKFKDLALLCKLSPAELDLYMWYMKTKEILK